MSTPTIDYDALAKQAGAIQTSANQPATQPTGQPDYDALAKQAGALPSAPAPVQQEPTQTPQPTATISAIHEPTTFLGKFGRWAENPVV